MKEPEKLDIAKIRRDFPMFGRSAGRANKPPGRPFVYLDTASSSQTPLQVLGAMDDYYRRYRANIHRGMYKASETATERFEAVRRKAADLIQARREEEIVFTRGATESLNLLAYSLTRRLKPGDEVVLTAMEHHANLVPWQQLAKERGFALKFIPLADGFVLDMAAAKELIGPAAKIVSVVHASNVLGTVNPIRELAALAHKQGALFIVDAAQSAGHLPLNVRSADCDFLVFSGHKMLGPTGAGALYGKMRLLESLEPFMYGGDMILEVHRDRSTWNEVPWKFEAGTPDIGGVIGLGAAVDYIAFTGIERIRAHEEELTAYAIAGLSSVPGVRLWGPPAGKDRIGVISFTVEGVHPHDIATVLDAEGVCVRAGHHCAMPLLRDLGLVEGAARASFGLYNDKDDVDALVRGIEKAKKILRK